MARRDINGEAVKAIRELAGISQPELARRCGISQAGLSNIERRVRKASPQLSRVIADQLGVSLDAITSVVSEPEVAAS